MVETEIPKPIVRDMKLTFEGDLFDQWILFNQYNGSLH